MVYYFTNRGLGRGSVLVVHGKFETTGAGGGQLPVRSAGI